MGNPHAVQVVDTVDKVLREQARFHRTPSRLSQSRNAGFMQIVGKSHIQLRVFERGAGETLPAAPRLRGRCRGVLLGLLESPVEVDTRGGRLTIAWDGRDPASACADDGPPPPPLR